MEFTTIIDFVLFRGVPDTKKQLSKELIYNDFIDEFEAVLTIEADYVGFQNFDCNPTLKELQLTDQLYFRMRWKDGGQMATEIKHYMM